MVHFLFLEKVYSCKAKKTRLYKKNLLHFHGKFFVSQVVEEQQFFEHMLSLQKNEGSTLTHVQNRRKISANNSSGGGANNQVFLNVGNATLIEKTQHRDERCFCAPFLS